MYQKLSTRRALVKMLCAVCCVVVSRAFAVRTDYALSGIARLYHAAHKMLLIYHSLQSHSQTLALVRFVRLLASFALCRSFYFSFIIIVRVAAARRRRRRRCLCSVQSTVFLAISIRFELAHNLTDRATYSRFLCVRVSVTGKFHRFRTARVLCLGADGERSCAETCVLPVEKPKPTGPPRAIHPA